MKLEQVAHKHTLTGILKVLLFALLMLAPIFSVASRCLYVICNKNAYQSYSGITYENEYLNTINVPLNDIYFTFNNENSFYNSERKELTFTNLEYINGNLNNNQINTINDNLTIQIWFDTSLQSNYITWDGLNTNLGATNIQFTLKGNLVATNNLINTQNLNNILVYRQNNINSSLDNVFTYSVNEMENDQLFNWTKNTAIYTGINTMTTGIGITQEAIPILLTYWFLLTVIYVIVDIIINTFTLLTHFIQKKTS